MSRLGTATVIQGDARALPLPGADLCTVLGQMLRPCEALQIRQSVIQRIAVLVVDNASPWKRPIRCLPYGDGSQLPNVRLVNLDPGAHDTSMGPQTHGAYRAPIRRPLSLSELGRPTSTHSLGNRGQSHVCSRRARPGAVVHRQQFGRFLLEPLPAHGTREQDRRALRSHTALNRDGVPCITSGGTEHLPALSSTEPIRLHVHFHAASATGRQHAMNYSGTEPTALIARWRVNDPGELAKAARVPKPPPVPDGQMSLLDGGAA